MDASSALAIDNAKFRIGARDALSRSTDPQRGQYGPLGVRVWDVHVLLQTLLCSISLAVFDAFGAEATLIHRRRLRGCPRTDFVDFDILQLALSPTTCKPWHPQ